jgi:CRP-like cAMP-binding protein
VRHANEAGRLKAMATLAAGDTFGEAALMGVPRQPAFVRVETGTAAALAVDAGQLAALMQGLQQHQLPADSRPQQQQQQQGPALHLAEEPGSRH